MSNTDPLDTTEKTVTILAIIGGLLFFLFALTRCQLNFSSLSSFSEESEELVETSLKDGAPAATLPTSLALEDSVVGDDLTGDLSAVNRSLKTSLAENAALRGQIEELEDKVDSALKSSIQTRSGGDSVALAGAAIAPAAFDALKGKLALQEESALALTEEKKELTLALQEAQEQRSALEEKLAEQKAERALVPTEEKVDIATTAEYKSGLATLEKNWQEKLQQERSALEAKLKEVQKAHAQEAEALKLALRKEKTKQTFADNSDDLAPAAQKLIAQLEGYKANDPKQLEALYGRLAEQTGARRQLVLKYASGSSALTQDAQSRLNSLLEKADPKSYFIAVGYADQSGSADQNKTLSGKRATRAVEFMKKELSETQFAQAYYLGQTERFGPPASNRIVEVWEIAK